ncbi:MAG TPA: hypothetical protein VLF68_02100 [Candidatus Saccharimonadales bacterium]|nr:hypothetical protein [Candidatus Saccharimonadales bacterium]
MLKFILKVFVIFLPFAVVITLLCGLVAVSMQQYIREGASDPQIQIAEDLAAQLSQGIPVSSFVSGTKVDIRSSLSPFVIVYDKTGNVLQSNAQLNGKTPAVPQGVFDINKWKQPIVGHHLAFDFPQNETRFTWQPTDDVRIATVLVYYSSQKQSGYVLAGRSMREVQTRIENVYLRVFVAWVVTLFATLIAVIFAKVELRSLSRRN